MNTIRVCRLRLGIELIAVCSGVLGSARIHSEDKTAPNPSDSAPIIRLLDAKEPTVEVVGLSPKSLQALAKLRQSPEEWQKLFAVYVERRGESREQPAMLGSYRVSKDTLCFEPRFPLVAGVAYRAELHPANLPGQEGSIAKPIVKVLQLPQRKPADSTVVAQVYPSSDELPENQLKFYLHFSAPMGRGDVYEHIHLLRSDGSRDDRAFLELPQELWDRDGKRFTLFLDPGRIKRGLKPREDLGPVLEAGKRYTLVIDRSWQDAAGNPLKESYRKTFRVQPPEETQVDPKTWKITAPAAGTRSALVMRSPKPLDHALLQRMLWIIDDRGKKVSGLIEVSRQETCWSFTPSQPWRAGGYHLVADTRLEDRAGNNLARPFEVDELRLVERETKNETVRLPFEVK